MDPAQLGEGFQGFELKGVAAAAFGPVTPATWDLVADPRRFLTTSNLSIFEGGGDALYSDAPISTIDWPPSNDATPGFEHELPRYVRTDDLHHGAWLSTQTHLRGSGDSFHEDPVGIRAWYTTSDEKRFEAGALFVHPQIDVIDPSWELLYWTMVPEAQTGERLVLGVWWHGVADPEVQSVYAVAGYDGSDFELRALGEFPDEDPGYPKGVWSVDALARSTFIMEARAGYYRASWNGADLLVESFAVDLEWCSDSIEFARLPNQDVLVCREDRTTRTVKPDAGALGPVVEYACPGDECDAIGFGTLGDGLQILVRNDEGVHLVDGPGADPRLVYRGEDVVWAEFAQTTERPGNDIILYMRGEDGQDRRAAIIRPYPCVE